jgi:hypothetical protein
LRDAANAPMAIPDKIRIPLDEYHFQNVGRSHDGA